MNQAKIVAMLTKEGQASVMGVGEAIDQVILAADVAATVTARQAADCLADGASPERALEEVISAIREMYWGYHEAAIKAAGK